MSSEPLIEFLKSPSKLLSEKNAIRIQINIITQPGRIIVPCFIDNQLLENVDQSQVQKCVVCYNICVFLIIFPCGHLICGNCYLRHFKFNHSKRFESYYTQCPHCTKFIKYIDALTLSQELEGRPYSNPALFYNNAQCQCDNDGCNEKLSLSKWYKHIKFTCDHRIVKCPADKCSIIGKPNIICAHSFQCPFHTTWCAGCKTNWTVLATGHNCEKSKEYQERLGNIYQLSRNMEPNEDGAVSLEINHQTPKTNDIVSLEQVEQIVSELEYKDKMNKLYVKPICYQPKFSHSNLCSIDENTQLSNIH
jgi:hypothetical protein